MKLVIGAAMSGKTYFLQQTAAKLQKSGERVLYVVPEQFVFESERALLKLSGAAAGLNAEIVSLSRLAHRLGADGAVALDMAARQAVMYLAVGQVRAGLEIYERQSQTADFITFACDVSSRFKRENISSTQLAKMSIATDDSRLKRKLNDFSLIFSAAEQLYADRYFDPDDDLKRLADLLKKNNPYKGWHLLADSFTDFTKAEQEVLTALMRDAADCYISLPGDPKTFFSAPSETDLFYISKCTALRLIEICRRENIPQSEPVMLEKSYFGKPLLTYAESCFTDPASEKPAPENDGSITLTACKSRYTEAETTAVKIRETARINGWRYGEMAVIARNPSDWRGLLDRALTRHNIPFFWDSGRVLSDTPLFRFVLSALECCDGGRDAIFACAKAGFFAVDPEAAERAEIFAFVNNKNSFSDFCEKWEDSTAESVRSKIMPPLVKLRKETASCGAKTFCETVYNLLTGCNIESKLAEFETLATESALEPVYADPVRSYNMLIKLLDSLVAAFSSNSQNFTRKEYVRLLRLMAANVKIGEIPQMIDAVHVGNAGLVRSANIKAVFVIGANDSVFPAPPPDSPEFTQTERKILSDMGVELGDDIGKSIAREDYLVYTSCFCATDMLHITWKTGDDDGRQAYPSAFVTMFEKKLPRTCLQSDKTKPLLDKITLPCDAFSIPDAAEPLRRLGYGETLARGQALADFGRQWRAPETAESLYKDTVRLSPSGINNYLTCRFRFFCGSVLKASAPRQKKLNVLEYGIAFHHVVEEILKENAPADLLLMAPETLHSMVTGLLGAHSPEIFQRLDKTDPQARYYNDRLKEQICSDILRLSGIFAAEQFRPVEFEYDIAKANSQLTITDGETNVMVSGHADRIDIAETDGKTAYLRVIDYKTSQATLFSGSDPEKGKHLQLIYYLDALTSSGKYEKAIPAGFLYCPLGQTTKNPKMAGFLLTDAVNQGLFASPLKDFYPDKTKDDFTEVFETARSHALSVACGLKQGNFDAGARDARDCGNCDFSRVCYKRGFFEEEEEE